LPSSSASVKGFGRKCIALGSCLYLE
jgi:hypothetical protein